MILFKTALQLESHSSKMQVILYEQMCKMPGQGSKLLVHSRIWHMLMAFPCFLGNMLEMQQCLLLIVGV